MLRITLPTREDPPVFVLEGRLAGLWVKELIRVTRDLGPRTTSVFDIEDVIYVDSLGEETLLWLSRLGATFITMNAYGKDLCRRLHLRRTTLARSGAQGSPGRSSEKTAQDAPLLLSKPRGSPS